MEIGIAIIAICLIVMAGLFIRLVRNEKKIESMTDKVQKIREEVARLMNELIQEKEKDCGSDIDDACILELQNVLTYIDSLQEEPAGLEKGKLMGMLEDSLSKETKDSWNERLDKKEPVSEDCPIWLDELDTKLKSMSKKEFQKVMRKYEEECKLQEEPVSEDLEEAAKRYATEGDEISGLYIIDEEVEAFKAGAKWQKANLWKPADGDDLPVYEREVVVFTQNYPNDAGMMMVAIGHRPTTEGFDGKSLTTGEVEHYTPKTYDKGGWNIPDVKYWLDVELPKEIEL